MGQAYGGCLAENLWGLWLTTSIAPPHPRTPTSGRKNFGTPESFPGPSDQLWEIMSSLSQKGCKQKGAKHPAKVWARRSLPGWRVQEVISTPSQTKSPKA